MSIEATSSVLIVDDSAEIREYLELLLQQRGYQVHAAADGREALAFLSSSPRPAVILLDLAMPQMDGWTLMDKLRADPVLAAIPVAIFSASPLAPPPGARAVLMKPSTPAEVLATVARLIAEDRRTAPRFPIQLELTADDGQSTADALTLNLSRGGVLFHSNASAAIGQTLTLSLRIDPTHEVTIKSEVRHVYLEHSGWRVGARFLSIAFGADALESLLRTMDRPA
jgi:two-component system, chemotaxis family, chemotaxis protein CheY